MLTSPPPRQLELALGLDRDPTLDNYRPGANAEALAAVKAMVEGRGEPFVYLFGGPTTGKTHLLQAACNAAIERGRRAQLIPLDQPGLTPCILEGLARCDLLAIDDLQNIAGQETWELALFALFNETRAHAGALLVSARHAPDELGIRLPDLASRMHWGPRYRLQPLDDQECSELIMQVAAELGLLLRPDVAGFIMRNHPRDPDSLVTLVRLIDRVSLREQRQPTLPLVRKIMRGEL